MIIAGIPALQPKGGKTMKTGVKWRSFFGAVMLGGMLCACGGETPGAAAPEPQETAAEPAQTQEAAAVTEAAQETVPTEAVTEPAAEQTEIRIGSLKGPTSIGLLELMDQTQTGEKSGYTFTMETQADALLPKMISGELDIALVPANVAGVLYNKTQGGVVVIDINTLGVLYMVSGDTTIGSVADLAGHTIYTTGKGTTPEYVLQYILEGNGIEAQVEYKSEATEVAAVLAEDPDDVGMLPQPFATVALKKNDSLQIVLDMTKEWEALDADSALVTGVTIVRREFLEQHPDAVDAFLKDHEASSESAKQNPAEAAEQMVAQGILENAQIAQAAIPYCNLVCITGEEMKTKLASYLAVLFDADPASVGGALPEEDFYYTGR